MAKKRFRIGGGQGFWGDSNDAAIHMIRNGELDCMACDYLAELTMSILQKQKNKNPKAGYARDFIELFQHVGKEAREKNIQIITNAGGVNVKGAVDAICESAKKQGIRDLRVGYVLGDDLTERLPELIAAGLDFKNMDDPDKDFSDISQSIFNVNVYYGHEPIAQCLEEGADVVVCGRATDSALFLAPLKKAFGWADTDFDDLARGIVTGHLLECGGQAAGGNFDFDWRSVPDMDRLGFPIAELSSDSLVITKAPDCGGLISERTLKEQLLYEIHDPANYITPDVIADVGHVTLDEIGENRVRVSGVRGKRRPDTLKLCIGYHAGYKVETYLSYAWPDAYEKAVCAADIIMRKLRRQDFLAEDVRIDFLGLNALHMRVADMNPRLLEDMNEVVLRIAVRSTDRSEAAKIIPEIAPLQLNGPPGASFFGGRAQIRDLIGLWPTLIPREAIRLTSQIREVR
ncbi:MAG: DUF1446 domain-containing protein [Clostridiales Family XIII bacterium]|nr:DUF1446 domain-containing protein [Clostridiales Family XIII bacterium]